MVVLSVDQNSATNSIYNQLKSSSSSTSITLLINNLFNQGGKKAVGLGPFNQQVVNTLHSENWIQFLT